MRRVIEKGAKILAVVLVMCLLASCGTTDLSSGDSADGQNSGNDNQKVMFTTESTVQNEAEVESVADVHQGLTHDDDPTRIIMISKDKLTDRGFTVSTDVNDQSSSTGTEVQNKPSPGSLKEFTLMVYMVGSTLEYDEKYGMLGNGTADIVEMLKAGVDFSKMNLIVYTGGAFSWYGGIPANHNCYLDLSKYDGSRNLRSCVVATTQGDPNMGAAKTFKDFLGFCHDNFPSKNYGLIFWDHGGGPISGFGNDARHDYDSLTLSEMREALDSIPFLDNEKLSFVGFDACLMGSIENAVIWKDYSEYLVASEEMEPGCGWDYRALGSFDANDIEKSIESLIELSAETIYGQGGSVTLSVMDLSGTETVLSKLNDLFDRALVDLRKGNSVDIQRVRYNSKEFGKGKDPASSVDLVDIYDFADRLSRLYPTESESVKAALQSFIVSQSTNIRGANGVTIYYPSRSVTTCLQLMYQNNPP